MVKFSVFVFTVIAFISCINIDRYETGRNPKFKNTCHLHYEKLKTTRADIFFAPYYNIDFNKKVTPFPNIGICGGCCVGKQKQVTIKVCLVCDSIYKTAN